MSRFRLGIDVGGTNTDAVVVTGDRVVAKAKRPTTPDVTGGILDALDAALADAAVDPDRIGAAMLGTTHCTNAIAERDGLDRVGVLRVGAPATLSVPPLCEWPDDLVDAVGGDVAIVEGGYEFDGREIVPLDEDDVRAALEGFDAVDAVAVTGVFSPVRPDHEERVAAVAREVLGDVPVSRSSDVGSVGLRDRENATVLNAALTGVADRTVAGFRDATAARGLDCALFFGGNDGTLMDVERVREYPIFTVASGPSNSIRGAAHLSGVRDALVVDVGGTTTDVGAVRDGFPRESTTPVEIDGVRTNLRTPDILSRALGGGSRVRVRDDGVTVGPDSVGHELPSMGLAFGGETTTATDLAVAAGTVAVGSTDPDLPPAVADAGLSRVQDDLAEAIDRMKTSADPVPVVAVGGGSFLVPDGIDGVTVVRRPEHYEVANAVGVAIADVSGHLDRVYNLAERSREETVAAAKREAVEDAVAAGADAEAVEVIAVEEVPLSYLPGEVVRLRVTAAGPLRW